MKYALLLFSLLGLLGATVPCRPPAPSALANTAWKGILTIKKTPTMVVLYFQADTMSIYVAEGMHLVERGVYKVEKNTFRTQKISGISPCDEQTVATCAFTLTDNVLLVKPLTDDCAARLHAWSNLPYNKVPVPAK